MSSNLPVDLAFEHFKEHRATIDSARGCNEATTRLRSIDTMLFDVLGWARTDIESERYSRVSGFVDYCVLNGKTISTVIEAKRDDRYFVLEGREYSDRPVSLGFVASESKEAGNAFTQALNYATSLGSRYCAITNGHQWLITLAFVAGQQFDDRSVLVFESIDAIESRFRQFFEAFSPTGIAANAVADRLLESRRALAPAKLSVNIPGYPVPAQRNKLANEIGWVVNLVWDSANQNDADEEFLRRCYIKPESTAANLRQTKEIIEQRRKDDEQSYGFEAVAAERAMQVVAASTLPERPIILLGRIGHGKSTFLYYLRLIEASSQLENYIQVDVDFLSQPATAPEVESYVFGCIDDQLLKSKQIDIKEAKFSRAALHSELARFRRTLRGSRHPADSPEQQELELDFMESVQSKELEYLTHVVRHLKQSHRASFAIFFDNLDRRPDDIQEEAFLRASTLAREWEALVFVCLRPGTFSRSSAMGVLDTIAPKTLSISAPRPDLVLKKRFRFAASVARGEQVRSDDLTRSAASKNVSVELPSAARFFDCCRDSFHRNRELNEMFAAAANGNIRRLLKYVRDFMTSDHLDTGKILRALERRGYMIAVHEAVRALLFGNSWHYDPNQSPFPNLFDISHADRAEHFIRILTLSYLERVPDTSTALGFSQQRDLVAYLCQLGYGPETASRAIESLENSGCIERRIDDQLTPTGSSEYRITALGHYLLRKLVGRFNYLDAVVVDTPILDEFTREHVKDVNTIHDRIERARLFREYLCECAESIQDDHARQTWRDISKALEQDIKEVSIRIGYHRSATQK